MPAADANPLCLSCGLCCNGTLLAYACLEPGETETTRLNQWRGAGLRLTRHDPGDWCFELPCGALQPDRRCACYATRPQICARFRCKLLHRYQSGDLELAAAQDTVVRIQGLIAGLEARLTPPGEAAPLPFHRRLHQFRTSYAELDLLQRESHSETMVQHNALLRLFHHHFGVSSG